ncbi:hypothetical protein F5Y12DRAFT_400598 [Xylaria sp. FL1777]|nr:hypothetical protein F5Y12DRAFT_400598 [Xylaria sp. FL1777]
MVLEIGRRRHDIDAHASSFCSHQLQRLYRPVIRHVHLHYLYREGHAGQVPKRHSTQLKRGLGSGLSLAVATGNVGDGADHVAWQDPTLSCVGAVVCTRTPPTSRDPDKTTILENSCEEVCEEVCEVRSPYCLYEGHVDSRGGHSKGDRTPNNAAVVHDPIEYMAVYIGLTTTLLRTCILSGVTMVRIKGSRWRCSAITICGCRACRKLFHFPRWKVPCLHSCQIFFCFHIFATSWQLSVRNGSIPLSLVLPEG